MANEKTGLTRAQDLAVRVWEIDFVTRFTRKWDRLWNGGNGWGTIRLYKKQDGQLILVDEVEATHIGCEYGEYDHEEPY